MPIFEYRCADCHHTYEQLTVGSSNKEPECPKCGSKKATKLMSAGTIRAEGMASTGESSCASGNCGMPVPCCANGSCGHNH